MGPKLAENNRRLFEAERRANYDNNSPIDTAASSQGYCKLDNSRSGGGGGGGIGYKVEHCFKEKIAIYKYLRRKTFYKNATKNLIWKELRVT